MLRGGGPCVGNESNQPDESSVVVKPEKHSDSEIRRIQNPWAKGVMENAGGGFTRVVREAGE
jgi:hypothetical protein